MGQFVLKQVCLAEQADLGAQATFLDRVAGIMKEVAVPHQL